MKIRTRVPFALSLLAASLTQSVWAVPTSGAYTTDKQNTWVQDRVGDRIGTVNMIMCIIGSMRGDAMVNQGPYVALIDQAKCEGRGDSSKSSSTSAGASNAANYMSAVVDATQATTTDPLVIKAWLHQEENGQKATIYAYVEATDGKSSTNPNGLFKMYFCGEPDGMPGTCMFKGSLQSTAQGLSFYEDDGGNGGGTTQLFLQNNPSTDSGLGGISGIDSNNGTPTPYNYTFAYDSNYFRRKEGANPDVCFARDKTVAETSTWRYGTYNADGSRLDIANPGFSVKYQNGAETEYGYWSFWGLWLPDSAMSNLANNIGTLTRKTASGDEALTITQKGGKLWKLSRQTATLNDFKNVPMMFWSNAAIGTGPSNGNYQIQWDGSNLTATAYQVCNSNGCSTTAFSTPVTIDSTFLSTNHINSIQMFFPSGGGNGAIDVSGGVSGTSTVSYRTRDVVPYTAADVGLHCVMNCTKSGTALTGALTTPSATPFQDTPAWGPASTQYAYTFHAGMLHDGGGDVDASSVTASALQGTSYQWGVTSGFMVADADLSNIKCDVNGTANSSGTYYCGQLMDKLSTVYQWETGPNQWNKYVGAAGIT
ncbi:MAG TPA: hypothetical protein VFM48_01345, partial [Aquabacterium sp.]|nr:hypothetical protein [Aquabacterium sp.]